MLSKWRINLQPLTIIKPMMDRIIKENMLYDNQKLSKPSEHSININSKNYFLFMKCMIRKFKLD